MNLKPEALESNGYVLLEKLDHMELIPFVRKYNNKWTRFSTIYILANMIAFGSVGYYLFHYSQLGYFTLGDGAMYCGYGFVIAFVALLPLHEYIHVLAYKSQGAEHTSYDANLRKFYFLAVADQFVASRKEFQIVALAPFVVITSILLILFFFTPPTWTMTVLSVFLTHTALCSGDFGLLSFFDVNRAKEVVTYDDRANKVSYFYGK
ncbi:MAG: DUF3267 domain-containing protein [Saprospiraceae bacterium]|nr:DUF3267 domain-containing protein [Candidatus Opimibacter iunctus]